MDKLRLTDVLVERLRNGANELRDFGSGPPNRLGIADKYDEAADAIEALQRSNDAKDEALQQIAGMPGGCKDEWGNFLSENEHMADIARKAFGEDYNG
jgi:hypothetical protein